MIYGSLSIKKQDYERLRQTKRKESFEITIHLGYLPDGKRDVYRETFKGGKREAENRKSELVTRYNQGELQRNTKYTMDEYLTLWLKDALKGNVSPRTYNDYKEIIEVRIKPRIGHIKLHQLSPFDVQALYTQFREGGHTGRTIHHTHTVLSRALQQAVKWNYIPRNVAKLVDLPSVDNKEMLAFDAQQAARFLEEAKKDEHFVLWVLALDSGARPEEYLALQWSDFNAEHGTISIQRALCWNRDGSKGWYYAPPKTRTAKRAIPLSPVTCQLLIEHRERQTEIKSKSKKWTDNNLIFCNSRGNPLLISNLRRRHFKPILEAAKLPIEFRMYDLRHSCATLLLERNIHPKIVQDRLGHSTIILTLNTYSHVIPGMQDKARDALHAAVFSGMAQIDSRHLVGNNEEIVEAESA